MNKVEYIYIYFSINLR